MQLAHYELKEEQRCLCRLSIFGEVSLYALLLLAAERWICQYYVNTFFLPDLGELEAQGIARIDLRRVEAMQEQVHLPKKIRKGFGLRSHWLKSKSSNSKRKLLRREKSFAKQTSQGSIGNFMSSLETLIAL
jgi:hypothetical protein